MYKIFINDNDLVHITYDGTTIAYGYERLAYNIWLGHATDKTGAQTKVKAHSREQLIFKLKLLLINMGYDDSILDEELSDDKSKV